MELIERLEKTSALTPAVKQSIQLQVRDAQAAADKARDSALAIEVDSPEMLEIAGESLRGFATTISALEARRLEITRPIDAAKGVVMDLFRGPAGTLAEGEKHLRAQVTSYTAEQERLRRVEQARVAEEQRKERARLEAEATAALAARAQALEAGDTEAAAQAEAKLGTVEQQVEDVELFAAPVARTASVAGIGTRKAWKVGNIDLKALVEAAAKDFDRYGVYLLADEKALGGLARSLKEKASVPGVTFAEESGISVRKL